MSATHNIAILSALLTLFFAIYYQVILRDTLTHAGYWRTAEALNNHQCIKIPELQACEKLVLHHPSGVVYLACSTPASRMAWEPFSGHLNASGRSLTDYVATYDPTTSKITRLKITGFPTSVPLALHGFDVVPSDENPADLFVYLINHRPPPGKNAAMYGADSVVEIFKTKIGGDTLVYVTTVEDPTVMISPNDLIGYGDGQSFHFTNDNRSKLGFMRTVDIWLRLPGKSVGYCHADHGCKFATTGLRGANGIARDKDGTYFVANNLFGEIFVLEKQDDETLVLTDTLKTDRPMDNISTDERGVLYIAAFPNALQLFMEASKDYSILTPSSVLRLSRNTGSGQFFGEKYNIEKIFEDNGSIVSAATSAVWDHKSKRMFLSGYISSHVAICKLDEI